MSYTVSVLLTLISSLLGAVSQLSLKVGSKRIEKKVETVIRNHFLLIGVMLYGVASLIFIVALRGGELTVLYPIAALSYVWVSFLSVKYLEEKMNIYKWIGIILIIVGVSLIV